VLRRSLDWTTIGHHCRRASDTVGIATGGVVAISLQELGDQVKAARDDRKLSAAQLAEAISPPTNRSAVSHLEQGRRLGDPDVLQRICTFLSIPQKYWRPFLDETYRIRLEFEEALSELVGRPVTLRYHDEHATAVAQRAIVSLFQSTLTDRQSWEALNSILVYYDVSPMSEQFFTRYFNEDATKSTASLLLAVQRFQTEAIRLFSTFGEAYGRLNEPGALDEHLLPLAVRRIDSYRNRRAWDAVEVIPADRLSDLGYISAARARQESEERQMLADFLVELADKISKDGKGAIASYSEKKRRKMGSLLRKFQSQFEHDLLSPLFSPDSDAIRREAAALAPKNSGDLDRIEATQAQAQRNLSRYLSADYLDVYIATSMRSDADFVSVSRFTGDLFAHDDVRPFKLRYFDPTQSWIEDRVAKGLVEALMLRRSSMTIYMAQKTDTFGKDSEASVALGQGKPVLVFVPRLYWPNGDLDSEEMGRKPRSEVERLLAVEGEADDKEPDPTVDLQSLLARLLTIRLKRIRADILAELVRHHWADFDLYGEDHRIEEPEERGAYRSWLDAAVRRASNDPPTDVVRNHLIGILVAVTVRFEARARLFREQHPLALQVILSSGVLNGILVARSVDACAKLVSALIRNELSLKLEDDEHNYRLVETTTGSTIRVISRHTLIVNAFGAFYAARHKS
jgi:transcriptional regulator with XRE-family HTH domain